MRGRRIMAAPPRYPGYAGDLNSTADFAKCGNERRMAILAAIVRLMQMQQESLSRADERLEIARKAVDTELTELAEERAFLADLMASYIDFSQVIAAEASNAILAGQDALLND